MPTIESSIEINCPSDWVYDVSQNYSIRYDWDPFPASIEFMGEATEVCVGAQVKVVATSGWSMVVEFIQVSPPEVTAIKMVKGPVIFKRFAGSWRFQPLPGGKTKAIFKYTIKAKRWAFPWVADTVLSWYFGRKVNARLLGLARYCEKINH